MEFSMYELIYHHQFLIFFGVIRLVFGSDH